MTNHTLQRYCAAALVSVALVGALRATPAHAGGVAGGGLDLAFGEFDAILGLHVNGYGEVPGLEALRIGGGLSYFFIDGATLVTVDPAVHYRFVRTNPLDVYGLAGLDLAYAHVNVLGTSASDTDIGVIVGGGLEAPVGDTLRPFAEGRIAVHEDLYLALTGGIRAAF